MSGILTIVHCSFTPDAIHEGSIDYDQVTVVETEFSVNASDAARLIRAEGLSFAASGAGWAANPDGLRTTDYATGEMTETTATLHGFRDRVVTAIMSVVDRPDCAHERCGYGDCSWIENGGEPMRYNDETLCPHHFNNGCRRDGNR